MPLYTQPPHMYKYHTEHFTEPVIAIFRGLPSGTGEPLSLVRVHDGHQIIVCHPFSHRGEPTMTCGSGKVRSQFLSLNDQPTRIYAHARTGMAAEHEPEGPSLGLVKAALLRSYLECSERGLQYSANWYRRYHLSLKAVALPFT